jgi:hypothetical protein
MTDSRKKREIRKGIKEIYGEIEKIRKVSLKKALKSLRELKRKVG